MTTVSAVDPCTDPSWDQLARGASVFESARWARVVRDAFQVTPVGYVLADDAGRPTAGLPACRIDDLVGPRLSTMAFADYAGPVGRLADGDLESLVTAVLAEGLPYRIRTHTTPLLVDNLGFTAAGTTRWHTIDVEADADVMWNGLSSKARQNIRRAEREGVTISIGSSRACVAGFEDLHLGLRRAKYGMLAQPPEFFDALREHFGDDLAVVTASVDGDAVAAILMLRCGDRSYYKFNASNPQAQSFRANDLCMWWAMQHAGREWGTRELDLGISDLDQPGLLRYKEKYATRSADVVTYECPRTDDAALSTEAQSLVRTVAATVAGPGTPDDVCRAVSSAVYRYFC